MTRTRMVDGHRVPLTEAEETARDAEEAAREEAFVPEKLVAIERELERRVLSEFSEARQRELIMAVLASSTAIRPISAEDRAASDAMIGRITDLRSKAKALSTAVESDRDTDIFDDARWS